MTAAAFPVTLCMYDLSNGLAAQMSAQILGVHFDAIWHTSIVVFDTEFYFDGGVGIAACQPPFTSRFGRPIRQVRHSTRVDRATFLNWVESIGQVKYGPGDYDMIRRNCNHFSEDALMFLASETLPDTVSHMIPRLLATPQGRMMLPMLGQGAPSAGPPPSRGAPASSSQPPSRPSYTIPPPALPSAAAATHIRLSEVELTDDEETVLVVAVTDVVDSCTRQVRDAVSSIIAKVLENPNELSKFGRLSASSTIFRELIASSPEALELLRALGFSGTAAPHPTHVALGATPVKRHAYELVAAMLSSAVEDVASPVPPPSATKNATEWDAAPNVSDDAAAAASSTVPVAATMSSPTRPHQVAAPAVAWVAVTDGVVPPMAVVGGQESDGTPLFIARQRIPRAPAADPSSTARWRHGKAAPHLQFANVSDHERAAELSGQREGIELLVLSRPPPVPGGASTSPLAVRVGWLSLAESKKYLDSGAVALIPFEAAEECAVSASRAFVARGRFESGIHPAEYFQGTDTAYLPWGGIARQVGRPSVDVLVAMSSDTAASSSVPASTFVEVEVSHQRQLQSPLSTSCPSACDLACGALPSLAALEAWRVNRGTETAGQKRGRPGDAAEPRPAPPRRAAPRPLLLVCHDHRGGYTEEDRGCACRDVSATAAAPPYHFQAWDATDIFVYFSHHRVTVPPREWIQSARRNGTAVLGTLIFEWDAGAEDLHRELLLMNLDGTPCGSDERFDDRCDRVICGLVQLCQAHDFDGWLVNVECPVVMMASHPAVTTTVASRATGPERLRLFVSRLRDACHRSLPTRCALDASGHRVLWYDAVTTEGTLRWQNGLHPTLNKPFFDASDGIFVNYGWTERLAALSAKVAGERVHDVFMGVDVYGRGTFGGGQWHTNDAVETAVVQHQLSSAVFAPGWTASPEAAKLEPLETRGSGSSPHLPSLETFLRRDQHFWGLIRPFAPRSFDPLSGPPMTAGATLAQGCFSRGCGTRFFLEGLELSLSPQTMGERDSRCWMFPSLADEARCATACCGDDEDNATAVRPVWIGADSHPLWSSAAGGGTGGGMPLRIALNSSDSVTSGPREVALELVVAVQRRDAALPRILAEDDVTWLRATLGPVVGTTVVARGHGEWRRCGKDWSHRDNPRADRTAGEVPTTSDATVVWMHVKWTFTVSAGAANSVGLTAATVAVTADPKVLRDADVRSITVGSYAVRVKRPASRAHADPTSLAAAIFPGGNNATSPAACPQISARWRWSRDAHRERTITFQMCDVPQEASGSPTAEVISSRRFVVVFERRRVGPAVCLGSGEVIHGNKWELIVGPPGACGGDGPALYVATVDALFRITDVTSVEAVSPS